MYFFKIDISSFDDEAKTLFIVPEQTADEKGVPFSEKLVTQTAEYKAFIKDTKTNIVDCTYTQYKTDAPLTEVMTAQQFEQLMAENKLTVLDSNSLSITTGKTAASKGGNKNLMTYLIIGGAALLFIIIMIVSFASKGSEQPPAQTEETTSVSETTATTETPVTETTTVQTSEIPEETTTETSEQEFVDEPVSETTEPPTEETNENGYSDSGYSSSSTSGTSGVYTIKFSNNGGEGTLSSISTEAGQYVVLPSAETAAKYIFKKGYKLIGFSDNTEISYPLYDYKMPYEDITMFAVWEADNFTVVSNIY